MNRDVSCSSFDNALLKISRRKVESFFQRLRNISCSYLTLLLETMLYPKYNGNHCIQFEFIKHKLSEIYTRVGTLIINEMYMYGIMQREKL